MTCLQKCENCVHFRGSPYEDSYCGHPEADGRPFCVSWKGSVCNPENRYPLFEPKKKVHRHCVYVGPREHLKGKTALVREAHQYGIAAVLVQFDDTSLTLDGEPIPMETRLEYEPHALFPTENKVSFKIPPPGALGYNWHLFPAEDFEEEKAP